MSCQKNVSADSNKKQIEYANSENNVFLVKNEQQKINFITWILDMPEEYSNKKLDAILSENTNSIRTLDYILKAAEVLTIVVEENYVDRTYRDSYYSYYAAKHFNYSRFCTRLCLFDGELNNKFYDLDEYYLQDKFVGSVVLRPLKKKIGRCLLSPAYYLENNQYSVRTAKYKITFFGKRLKVKAFPYMSQDGETTTCAEVTILNMCDYYSQSYQEYKFLLPSDIHKVAEQDLFQRTMPTKGMTYQLISKILTKSGFYPRLHGSEVTNPDTLIFTYKAYIDSGIPVGVGISWEEGRHSIISIGHKNPNFGNAKKHKQNIKNYLFMSENNSELDKEEEASITDIYALNIADLYNEFVFIDDCRKPYNIMTLCTSNSKSSSDKTNKTDSDQESEDKPRLEDCSTGKEYDIDYLTIPLGKRMIMEAADARAIFLNLLVDNIVGKSKYPYRLYKGLGTYDEPIVYRIFMASSRTFKNERDKQFSKNNKEMRVAYDTAVFPRFIWVCELSTLKLAKNKQIFGEIVLDATASPLAVFEAVILMNYGEIISAISPDKDSDSISKDFIYIDNPKPYEQFSENIFNVNINDKT